MYHITKNVMPIAIKIKMITAITEYILSFFDLERLYVHRSIKQIPSMRSKQNRAIQNHVSKYILSNYDIA